jgi:dsRNA-specific ribonuclease
MRSMHAAIPAIRARLQELAPVATTAGPADAEFQRLEFYGDAYLKLAVSEALMATTLVGFASPHMLTTMRIKMISNAHLALVYDVLELSKAMPGGEPREVKAKADVLEAAIGELSRNKSGEAMKLREELISLIATLSF